MKNKLRKIILVIVVFLILVIVFSSFYVFFIEKDYTFYIGNDMKNIESVELIIDASEGFEQRSIMIYDKEIIDSIMEKMSEYKLKPYYTIGQELGTDKGFSIILYGEDKKQLLYLANFTNTKCVVDIGMVTNGKIDENIRSWVGITSINKDKGQSLYEFVTKVLEENSKNIEISDIKELAEKKQYDWKVFKQFIFTNIEGMDDKIRGEMKSTDVAKFKINEKEAFMYVWYYEGTIEDSEGVNEYTEVCDAVIYNDEGESISIYDEGLEKFLEEIQ